MTIYCSTSRKAMCIATGMNGHCSDLYSKSALRPLWCHTRQKAKDIPTVSTMSQPGKGPRYKLRSTKAALAYLVKNTYKHTYTHKHKHTTTTTHTHKSTHKHTHTQRHTQTHKHTNTHMLTHTHTHTHMHTHTHRHTHKYTRTHTYTHTRKHTHKQADDRRKFWSWTRQVSSAGPLHTHLAHSSRNKINTNL